jgi:hypothetical protein
MDGIHARSQGVNVLFRFEEVQIQFAGKIRGTDGAVLPVR